MALDPLILESFSTLRPSIQSKNAGVNIGGVVTDVLTSVATESAKLKTLETFISGLQSLDSILAMQVDTVFIADVAESLNITPTQVQTLLTTSIETFAANLSMTRNPPTASTGLVAFERSTPLSAGDVTIPSGTTVHSISGVDYQTTATVVMLVASAPAYYNATLNMYIIEAPVQATILGTAGNTEANTITSESTFIPELPFVTNINAIVNGLDQETDEELVNRIKVTLTGNNIGAVDGYKKLVLQTGFVSDAAIIGASNPLMLRDRNFGGAVDIYLLETQLISITDTRIQGVIPDTQYVMAEQPVDSVLAVNGIKGAVPKVFVEGVDFNFVKDTNPLIASSVRASDKITWLPGQAPDASTSYTIQYLTDNNVQQVNNLFANTDTNAILGVDILVRQGIKINVDVSFELVLTADAVRTTVNTAVLQAMQTYVDNLKFGQVLNQSDLIAAAENTAGVDRVKIPVTQFNKTGYSGNVDYIPAAQNEYIRLQTVTLT